MRTYMLLLSSILLLTSSLYPQSAQPYPTARSDRFIHFKTPMAPPLVNTVFADPRLCVP